MVTLYLLLLIAVVSADIVIPADPTGAANWQGYITGPPGTTYRVRLLFFYYFYLSLFIKYIILEYIVVCWHSSLFQRGTKQQ
jgi:hypothetical protein